MRPVPTAILLTLGLAGCATPAPRLVLPDRFTALGTEPFWAAKVAGGRLTYATPLDQKGRNLAVIRRNGRDSVQIEGVLDGRALRLKISIGPCSDGMSDTVYPFTVARSIGGAVEHGCAKAG